MIRIPKYVDEALAIYKENGNTLWYTSIQKEMKKICVAFEAWEPGSLEYAMRGQNLVRYQEIRCHIIFDIKMNGRFTSKARYVAGGHTTDPPYSITHSSIVSRNSIIIAFTLASLNDIDIRAAEIGRLMLRP